MPQAKKVYHRYPELALYPTHKAARAVYSLPTDTDLTKVPKDRRDHRALPSWAHVLVPIEVDQDFHFESSQSRTRMYHYAARVLFHQHRLHLFTLHFQGTSKARIARWDRSGVVVSDAIDLSEHAHFLYDFIHRMGRLTREQQGFDTTVSLAPKHEIARLLRYTTTNEHLKRHHEEMLSNLEEWPIYAVGHPAVP